MNLKEAIHIVQILNISAVAELQKEVWDTPKTARYK